MLKLKVIRFLLLPAFALLLYGCENYFGKKTDLDFIEKPDFQARTVAYVPIQPIQEGFAYPTDVHAGFDELIYVVDNGTQEIIAFDQSLSELGRFQVPGVTKVVQDRNLDLLAVGTIDTFDTRNNSYTLACIYRIDLKGDNGYGLQHATVTNKIVHPFYTIRQNIISADQDIVFNDVAVLATNEYYVTRDGPSSTSVGPDQRVLLFDQNDKWITQISVSSEGATYDDYFKRPFAITTHCQPPQISASTSRTFIATMIDPDAVLKVHLINVVETNFGVSYEPEETIVGDTAQAEDFLQRPYRFKSPQDITITGDGTNFIFMVDAETDSLYQFTLNGLEGIKPPPGSPETKYIKASFGGTGQGADQFNEPKGVAYLENIVYVADAGNGRLLRFKLTLDFD